VRGYGDAADLVERLNAAFVEWDRTGRLFTTGLRIEAVDLKDETENPAEPGDFVIDKRWFRYKIRPEVASNPYFYVSYSEPLIPIDVTHLLQVATTHHPPHARTIPSFDYRSWLDGLLAKEPTEVDTGLGETPGSTAKAVFELLADDRYRNGPRAHLFTGANPIGALIERAVATDGPVRVVLPSFPGRPVNLLRHTRQQPDLGEAAALARLWQLHLAVSRIHAPGMRWVIVMDGVAYAPFYGYPIQPYAQYQQDLKAMAEQMGVGQAFEFVDLADLIAERQAEFDALYPRVVKEVADLWDDPDYTFRDKLVRAMKLGTNTAPVDAAAVQYVTFPAPESDNVIGRLAEALAERASQTAFDYTCLLVTLRRLELFTQRFPGAIRGTVHPKPGQYSPFLVNDRTRIVPWHGVAVMEADASVRSVYEAEILANPDCYQAVFLDGEYTPLFYEPLNNSLLEPSKT
jgi:pyoverdine/dityrosine biosynthesis protein Dit1